jgi:DNA-directed RNA polymerase subunit RPC12/RpoP
MFFLIGGVQPKTVSLDVAPRVCPGCGLAQAKLKRTDHYLSLFFVPLFRVKKGDPVLICDLCGPIAPAKGGSVQGSRGHRCPQCGYPAARDFRYCPVCGTRI